MGLSARISLSQIPRNVWRASLTRMPGPYVLVSRRHEDAMPCTR